MSAVSGTTVFVADGLAGLQVLDASNPRNLTLLSTYLAGSGKAFGVSVSGFTVFVADEYLAYKCWMPLIPEILPY